MAIVRTAGTEIIRAHHFEAVNSTAQNMIYGVQHHIYTVLSIIVQAQALNATGDYIGCRIDGYDSKAGTSAESIFIFQQDMSVGQTFVWNDMFSMNGFEPADFSGAMNAADDQDAIADQGGAVQILQIYGEHSSDNFDVSITFIDQNNA